MNIPIVDLHCDLLSYLVRVPGATPFKRDDIGCSIPALEEGNARLQVMAIYNASDKCSSDLGIRQARIFQNLLSEYPDQLTLVNDATALNGVTTSSKIGMVAAIENASGFCEEDEPLENGLTKLEEIIKTTGRILYIGMTHHLENRFGGGNTTQVGLKDDGRALLDYMSGRRIALDLAHTSDPLAYDILDHITKRNLDIPLIASHSNYRKVWDHPRNLPDDLALEVINRKGLIGVNFLRAFLNNDDPNALYDHLNYGIKLGGDDAVCFGADYFYTKSHPDPSRMPFFFPEHHDAGCYPSIIKGLSERVSGEITAKISHKNALNFIKNIWS